MQQILAKMERVIGKLNERRRIDRLIQTASMPRVEQGSWKDVLSQLNGKSAKLQALPQRRPAWKPESSIASAGKVKKDARSKEARILSSLPLDIRDMNVIDLEAHRIFLSANGFDQRLRPLSHPDLEEGSHKLQIRLQPREGKEEGKKRVEGENTLQRRKEPIREKCPQSRIKHSGGSSEADSKSTNTCRSDALPNRMLLEKDIENRMKTP